MNTIPAYEIVPDSPEHSDAVEALYDEVLARAASPRRPSACAKATPRLLTPASSPSIPKALRASFVSGR